MSGSKISLSITMESTITFIKILRRVVGGVVNSIHPTNKS